jgi:hypothetical protein
VARRRNSVPAFDGHTFDILYHFKVVWKLVRHYFPTAFVRCVPDGNAGPCFDQEPSHSHVPLLTRQVQRGVPFLVLHSHIRPLRHQLADEGRMVVPHALEQYR